MHYKAGHDDPHLGGGSSRIRHSRLFSAVQQGFEGSLSYVRPYYKKIIIINKLNKGHNRPGITYCKKARCLY